MAEKKPRKSVSKTARGPAGEAIAVEPQSLRGRIPSMAAAQSHARRALFGEAHVWSVGEVASLAFTPGSSEGGESFAVEADGTPMRVRIDNATPAGELHWTDYRGRARLLAWSLAHEPALRSLSNAIGASLLPVEQGDDAENDDDRIWLDFHADDADGSARLRGALRLPVGWVDRLLAHAQPVYDDDPSPEPGRWLDVPAPLSICCPGPTLDVAQWQALSPGDVIVVSRGRPPAFEARGAGRIWPLAKAETGWQVTGNARILPRHQDSESMNEHATDDTAAAEQPEGSHQDAQAARHPANDLPVQLAFEIGTQELSVGELAGLQPGYVFELPTRLEGSNVTVRANGRVAGRGELVAVGDTFGVRLLSWT